MRCGGSDAKSQLSAGSVVSAVAGVVGGGEAVQRRLYRHGPRVPHADHNTPMEYEGHVGRCVPGVTRPVSYATTTACTRSRSRSLARMRVMWVFTVASLRCRASASSVLLRPPASRVSTS